MLLLLSVLIVGTLKVDLFANSHAEISLPFSGTDGWQETLDRLVPYDASQGQEGVSVQGVLLIALLPFLRRRRIPYWLFRKSCSI